MIPPPPTQVSDGSIVVPVCRASFFCTQYTYAYINYGPQRQPRPFRVSEYLVYNYHGKGAKPTDQSQYKLSVHHHAPNRIRVF